ncbi:ATP-binding protein [Embleya sp. NPDC005971]|uniref:ATP-binding protein n=1 Tax=Embleya sp. NPDC005971 TaxID=3156724 RepID=UPI0033E47128
MFGPSCPAEKPVPAVPALPCHWIFPAHPRSVRRARYAVAEALPFDCRPQLRDELVLLTSELVTNAVRHAVDGQAGGDPSIEVAFWTGDGHHWLAVSDPGAGWPTIADPDPWTCGGRGLLLVNEVAAVWAVTPRPGCGKAVVVGLGLVR